MCSCWKIYGELKFSTHWILFRLVATFLIKVSLILLFLVLDVEMHNCPWEIEINPNMFECFAPCFLRSLPMLAIPKTVFFNTKDVLVFHLEISRLLEERFHFLGSGLLKFSTFKVFSNNPFISNPVPLCYPSFQSAFKLSICRTFRILFADDNKRISTQLIFPSLSLSK